MVRIGEVARRAGIPSATLRAWERRYEVVAPQRGASGYRLYSLEDQRRLESMAALVASGVAPAEAAARVRAGGADPDPAAGGGSPAEAIREELTDALLGFDSDAADAVVDRAVAALSTEAVLGEVVLPVLRNFGERWNEGTVTVAQEHFASNLLRGRLLGLARGWGGGSGRTALLACPPGEHHDLGLIGFGLMLRRRGWRVALLGADTPIGSIRETAESLSPDVVVVVAMRNELLSAVEPELRDLASRSKLLLAGPHVDTDLAAAVDAKVLTGDPLEAANSPALAA